MNKPLTILATLALATATFAADITGKWTGKFETPNGTRETTYTFKADGDKLTGSVTGRGGETPIQDGKISGDEISFSVTRNFGGNEFKINYTGKVSGDTIKLKFKMRGNDIEMTLKRATS